MRVAPEAAQKFIDLYTHLMYFTGQTRKILNPKVTLEEFKKHPLTGMLQCRDAIYQPKPLFDDFLKQALSVEERQIVQLWSKHHLFGKFFVVRHLKKHTVFMGMEPAERAYGVYGLRDDLENIIPSSYLPQLVETALLSYEGVIVCDGLFRSSNVFFGAGIRGSLKEDYELAKIDGRFYTSLTEAPPPPSPKELLDFRIKERGETPIRKVRGLTTQVKKVKQLEWELADTPDKKRAKLEQQLEAARLKLAALLVEFYEKDNSD
jgi:hypothetical protein